MGITIFNPTRNVRIAPRKSYTDPMDALRELVGYMPEAGGQCVEIQCDKAFWESTGLSEPLFEGIPITVRDANGQLVDVKAAA